MAEPGRIDAVVVVGWVHYDRCPGDPEGSVGRATDEPPHPAPKPCQEEGFWGLFDFLHLPVFTR